MLKSKLWVHNRGPKPSDRLKYDFYHKRYHCSVYRAPHPHQLAVHAMLMETKAPRMSLGGHMLAYALLDHMLGCALASEPICSTTSLTANHFFSLSNFLMR